MKYSFWLKVLFIALILNTHTYARNVSAFVDSLDLVDIERWQLFNHQSPVKSLDDNTRTKEIGLKTKHLNSIFQDPAQIAPNRRLASDEEKEILVKIRMRTAVIHLQDSKYSLERRDLQTIEKSLQSHFFSLYQIEDLVHSRLDPSTIDQNILRKHKMLEVLCGIDSATFNRWLNEVLAENAFGIHHRMKERIERLDSAIKNIKRDPTQHNILQFGEVATVQGSDHIRNKLVFISTYANANPRDAVHIKLPNRSDGSEAYISVQTPGSIKDVSAPFTIRAHFAFADNLDNYSEWLSAGITHGKNTHKDGSEFQVRVDPCFDIIIHNDNDGLGGKISPDNAHLSGLPERPLDEDETFSFVSEINGSKRVRTFHLLVGENYRHLLYDLTQGRLTFDDFLHNLNFIQSQETFGEALEALKAPNIRKYWKVGFPAEYTQWDYHQWEQFEQETIMPMLKAKKIERFQLNLHLSKMMAYIEEK